MEAFALSKDSSKRKARNSEVVAQTAPQVATEAKVRRLPILAISCAAALALSVTIYILRFDRVVGLIVDDAWYVLLAKSLATGGGYTLINSPTPGIHPFYAPGWPALLSIVFRIAPEFPANVWLLKSVSTAAMIGAGIILFYYFKDERELPPFVALGLALASTIYPAIVFLATSTIMSEAVFTLAQVAAIWVLTRGVRRFRIKPSWTFVLVGGLITSYAFLVRPAALGLLVAIPLWLLKERLFKQTALFVVIVACLTGPWVIYSRRGQPTAEQKQEQGANIVQSYSEQFWQRTAGQPQSGTITADDLPARVWKNLSEIGLYDFGSMAVYPAYRPLEPGEPVRIEREGRMVSLALATLALIGIIAVARERVTLAEIVVPLSLAVSVAWGWEQFRLLLPLVPFLLFYLVMGCRFLAKIGKSVSADLITRRELTVMLAISWFFALTALIGNWQFINRKYDPVQAYRLRWESSYAENELLMNHIAKTIPRDAVIATQNPALVYLYTGNKTVASDDPAGRWDSWTRSRVRYIAKTSPYPLPPVDAAEKQYSTIFQTNGPLGLSLIDLGEPGTRPAWPKN
jgi:hypothetical protein